MARRSQSSSQGDNPLDPNYLPPHYKEYYRLALDVLTEEGKESYQRFLADEGAPDFLCNSEVDHIIQNLQKPQYASQEGSTDTTADNDMDGSSGTYWPMNSDLAVPELDLGWPMVFGFRGTEVTTLVQPPPPDNPSIKEEARRMIRAAQQVRQQRAQLEQRHDYMCPELIQLCSQDLAEGKDDPKAPVYCIKASALWDHGEVFKGMLKHTKSSQNHRIVVVEKDLWRQSSPAPLLKTGLVKIRKGHVLEHLQGWRLHNLSGQLVQAFSDLYSKGGFSYV